MGRADLIGNGKHHLIPTWQPLTDGSYPSARRKNSTPVAPTPAKPAKGRILTQHTGLPPRDTGRGRTQAFRRQADPQGALSRSMPRRPPARGVSVSA